MKLPIIGCPIKNSKKRSWSIFLFVFNIFGKSTFWQVLARIGNFASIYRKVEFPKMLKANRKID